ncbi:YifB family Mg chelatase-like AAA ATPase [Streptomyces pilosus]|uniref:YifB family Mg chelatase-like AAA ATPase n=1 Tax=Streptomyces pilosus TaxID=28893 RepID=UPI0036F4BE66
MGFARTCSVALVGVEGVVVEVQADLEPGVAAFTLVGLPDKSLTESRDRVRAAVVNSGGEWPQKKLTVGLSPASVPKAGSGFDLAVACAVLGAAERIDPRVLADIVMIGELGLDGRVRPVRGILPAVLAAADAGYQQVVVPECAAAEAALVPGVSVLGVRNLRQLIAVLTDEPVPEEDTDDQDRPDPMLAGLRVPGTGAATGMHGIGAAPHDQGHDLADVVGQHSARTAVEVAAAGGHHLFLEGPPGAGKTMLAERLPSILPPLDRQASLEVTAVHSVAGLLPPGRPLIDTAPYCAPHHSATMQALVGGGPGTARPGAVSLSHRGVLFLDEARERDLLRDQGTPETRPRAAVAARRPRAALAARKPPARTPQPRRGSRPPRARTGRRRVRLRRRPRASYATTRIVASAHRRTTTAPRTVVLDGPTGAADQGVSHGTRGADSAYRQRQRGVRRGRLPERVPHGAGNVRRARRRVRRLRAAPGGRAGRDPRERPSGGCPCSWMVTSGGRCSADSSRKRGDWKPCRSTSYRKSPQSSKRSETVRESTRLPTRPHTPMI